MKMVIFVLNNVSKLDDLLIEFSSQGLKGATIINSTGMAQSLYEMDSPLMSSLKILLENDHKENKTIFAIVDQKGEQIFYDSIEKVIGPLTKPNSGIVFTLPVSNIKGLVKKD